jgi:uncharacterized protein YcbK (DUF882 family)
MSRNFSRRPVIRRAVLASLAASIVVAGSIGTDQSATAGQFFFALSPKKQIAVHDFGEEHAHLADSVYDTINPLVLAALPRGKAHVEYRAPAKCIPGSLRAVLARVSAKFGPITVNSTYRSPGKNRKAGGKGKSMHLSCRAVDFRVHGSTKGLTNYLLAQKEVGGYNRYPSGFYHIDNGPRRTW